MSPNAGAAESARCGGNAVDIGAAKPVLDLETRWGSHIERRHQVVGVSSEGHRDRDALLLNEVVGDAHVIEGRGFKHQMVVSDQPGDMHQRQREMQGVEMLEQQMYNVTIT